MTYDYLMEFLQNSDNNHLRLSPQLSRSRFKMSPAFRVTGTLFLNFYRSGEARAIFVRWVGPDTQVKTD